VILVDSTVWIDWLRARASAAVRQLDRLLEDGEAWLAPVILQEILQGARSPRALATLRDELGALPMLLPELTTYAEAGALYARCRWRGITIRSPRDCLIARIALEHDVALLHDDADFERLHEVEPRLRLIPRAAPGRSR